MAHAVTGTIQYKTQAEGDACLAWLDGWAASHSAEIYFQPNITNGHSLAPIDPPTVEGCVCQLTYEYHFDLEQAPSQFLIDEVERAVQVTYGTADCDSTSNSG